MNWTKKNPKEGQLCVPLQLESGVRDPGCRYFKNLKELSGFMKEPEKYPAVFKATLTFFLKKNANHGYNQVPIRFNVIPGGVRCGF
jgi:hypothetical protein